MKILVACEESQAVTIELRRLGHEAFSCDILECSGGHPEWHLQEDVTPLLKQRWDMIIAFPPCTHLAVSGAYVPKNIERCGILKRVETYTDTRTCTSCPLDGNCEFVKCKKKEI